MRGQASADAIAALQNHGFRTRTQQKPDSTIPPDHVIGTDPGANASVGAGDQITINVSTGPEQREVPDVSSLSYSEAVKKLKAAGFTKFKQVDSPSTPETERQGDRHQPAGQPDVGDHQRDHRHRRLRAVETKQVPDVAGPDGRLGPEEPHGLRLHQVQPAPVDSSRPAGDVIGTNPPRGPTVPVDSVDRAAGVQGQPVPDARPDGHVLDRRRTAVARAGLDRGDGQGCRRRRRRLPAQPGGVPEPGRGSGRQPGRHASR